MCHVTLNLAEMSAVKSQPSVPVPRGLIYYLFLLPGTLALNPERQSARKSTTRNGRLASLAPNPLVTVIVSELWAKWTPRGAGVPFWPISAFAPPLSIHFLIFCSFLLFLLFVFSFAFSYFLLLSIASLSTRIVPLRFQVGGHRRRPNLGLVCFVYFVLSVLLS